MRIRSGIVARRLGPIVVSGPAPWLAAVEDAARETGCRVVTYAASLPREALVARLAQDRAALLLVDAALPVWRAWVAAARTSPATRRIPIGVVAEAMAATGPDARDAGADRVLAPEELRQMVPRLLAEEAAKADAGGVARQCAEPLPPEGLEAIRLFNAGQYYRQHDVFEAMWMAEEGPVRNLYRAILQVGVGYYHIQRGNYRGAYKMLLRSVQWLDPLPDVCQGVDVAQLRLDSAQVRLALEAVLYSGSEAFDLSLLRPVALAEGRESS
jgi:CheY-like chemotaxis protein